MSVNSNSLKYQGNITRAGDFRGGDDDLGMRLPFFLMFEIDFGLQT